MAACPCCGQATATLPPASLPHIFAGQFLAGNALERLASAYPGPVPAAELVEAMYRGARKPACGRRRVSEAMATLRKAMAPYGWTISYPRRGRGSSGLYRLERVT